MRLKKLTAESAEGVDKKNLRNLRNLWMLFLQTWLLLALVGCQTAVNREIMPTAVPPALLPDAPMETAVFPPTAETAPLPETSPSATATPALIPTPEGSGLRPDQARQSFIRDAGPVGRSADEWRPPPMPAPVSIDPDDHYWLVRPIPSGYRNYDLEWYPFGNDVQAANVPPYRVHHGLDFPNETGTPVLAAGSGTVIHAGPFPSPGNGVNYYGNTVIIQHDWQWNGQDIFTLYAHTLELFVNVGDVVQPGQLIAGVGSSGEVTGPHLHFEVRVGENSYGHARNPTLWLAPYTGWGTLAGRLVDNRGRMISDAKIRLMAPGSSAILREQSTYHPTVRSDDVWRENFVIGDLPAGDYVLLLTVNDITYRREVRIMPGRTHFEIISTEFEFVPTPTPPPTATPTPTPTGEWTPEPTVEATPTPPGDSE
jgi:murein DD-endopeptidase MepM/ murein hydrolase activator NlpD